MDLKLGLPLIISTLMSASLVLAEHLVCPAHYLPVCGSDGKTYSNPCMLNSTAQMSGKEVTLIRYGRCGEPSQDDCVCPDNYKPVCGTDGQTYPNECSLECQKKRFDPILRVMDYSGPCQHPQPPACGCSQETSPVCASDGNTYRNNCILKCIARDNFMLTFVHAGPC